MRKSRWLSLLSSAWIVAIGLLMASPAQAYTWMIRHGYASCAACHVDPSGGSLLTPYGRAQFDLLVKMPFGEVAEGEVDPTSGFLFGAAELPEWLNATLALRGGLLQSSTAGKDANPIRPLVMVTDVRAAVDFGRVKAGAALGVAVRQAELAALTSPFREDGTASDVYLTSREHWLGYGSEDQSFLFRAGRIHQPFGLRIVEHNSWVREYTQTDINQDQQHGLAIAYNGEGVRGELMVIAGNFQVKPDLYRDRGYSLFIERTFLEKLAAGVSSKVTLTDHDLIERQNTIRQSHGLFARFAPIDMLALQAEFDAIIRSPGISDPSLGFVTFLQADLEILRGLHLMGTFEAVNPRAPNEGRGVGGWLSVEWFFAPHSGLRVDAIQRRQNIGISPVSTTTFLVQLHTYL